MIPMMLNRLGDTGANLDVEAINDNLEALATDVNRNLDQRYTYSAVRVDFDGGSIIPFRRPTADSAFEIVATELVIYAASGDWELTCPDDSTWPSLTVTAAGTTTEAYGISSNVVSVPSSSSNLRFQLIFPGVLTKGYAIFHIRADRGNQGASHAGYTPTRLNAASSTDGATLDTELTAGAAAVTRDTDNDKDLRAEAFTLWDQSLTTPIVLRLPSGARRIHALQLWVQDGDEEESVTATATGGITAIPVTVTLTDADLTYGVATAGADATQADDPTDSSDDLLITLTESSAKTWDFIQVVVWWS